MSAEDCIFCGIVAGSVPAFKVHEDEQTVAFMDINPATRGHCLVVPKAHADDIVAASASDIAACSTVASELAERAITKLGADGAAVISLCRPAAGQTVFHLHFHVIPRYEGDGLKAPWLPTVGDMAEIEATAEELRA